MTDDPRPGTNSVIATTASEQEGERIVDALTDAGIDIDAIINCTGESCAMALEGAEDDDEGPVARVGRWLTSFGREREAAVELGQYAREGRYVIIVHDVEDEATKDTVVDILTRHEATDIAHIGEWQTEEIIDAPTAEM